MDAHEQFMTDVALAHNNVQSGHYTDAQGWQHIRTALDTLCAARRTPSPAGPHWTLEWDRALLAWALTDPDGRTVARTPGYPAGQPEVTPQAATCWADDVIGRPQTWASAGAHRLYGT